MHYQHAHLSFKNEVHFYMLSVACSIYKLSYCFSKKPKKPQRRQNNRLKPLTLAYDGDADM